MKAFQITGINEFGVKEVPLLLHFPGLRVIGLHVNEVSVQRGSDARSARALGLVLFR